MPEREEGKDFAIVLPPTKLSGGYWGIKMGRMTFPYRFEDEADAKAFANEFWRAVESYVDKRINAAIQSTRRDALEELIDVVAGWKFKTPAIGDAIALVEHLRSLSPALPPKKGDDNGK